jgi:hypothetical protein
MTAFDTVTGLAYRCGNIYSHYRLRDGGVVDIISGSKIAETVARELE